MSMLARPVVATAPLAPAVVPSEYRCTGAGTEETLTLRPDHSYRWRDDHGVGTWRYDRRKRVFLIATGPLALRDPRDGPYSEGRIDLAFGEGQRIAYRIETIVKPVVHRTETFSGGAHFTAQQEQPTAR